MRPGLKQGIHKAFWNAASAVRRIGPFVPGQSLDPARAASDRWIALAQGQEAKFDALLLGRLRAATGESGKWVDRDIGGADGVPHKPLLVPQDPLDPGELRVNLLDGRKDRFTLFRQLPASNGQNGRYRFIRKIVRAFADDAPDLTGLLGRSAEQLGPRAGLIQIGHDGDGIVQNEVAGARPRGLMTRYSGDFKSPLEASKRRST
jgi:hypothetical protein